MAASNLFSIGLGKQQQIMKIKEQKIAKFIIEEVSNTGTQNYKKS